MDAKPLDIRVIKEDTREADYSVSYPNFISLFKQAISVLAPFFFCSVSAGGISWPPVTGIAICNFKRV
jgi:hypothetical protein